jgi:spermidine synthase
MRASAAAPIAIAVLLMLTGDPWDRELLASGSYKYASDVPPGVDVETALRAGTLVYYKDGPTGTVSVKRLTGQLSLAIDGKVDASTAGDMLTQKLLAHLPLLLHGNPQQVAIIGLGSGVTLASALTHPVRGVDALEISREVADASRLFAPAHASPLDDPRTRLVVADGRTHLALSTRQYDVIVSEPSNPWMAGVAALFTREFFEAAKARLAAGGIICQWVNTYDISAADLQSVVATFSSVFPHASLWLVGEGDLLILGSAEPFASRLPTMTQAWLRPGVAADLQPLAIVEPFGILSTYLGGNEAVARFRGDAPVQTDDRMALEFSAPRALRTSTRRDNVERLRLAAGHTERPAVIAQAWAQADGPALAHRAAMLYRAGAFEAAYQSAQDAVSRAPAHVEALTTLVESAVALDRQSEVATRLTQVIAQHPQLAAPRLALSRLHASRGALEDAARAAADALELLA